MSLKGNIMQMNVVIKSLIFILILSSFGCVQQDTLSQLEFKENATRRMASIEESSFEELRLTDREYVSNKLKFVFGTDNNVLSPLNANITFNRDVFTGSCDFYDQLVRPNAKSQMELINPSSQCLGANAITPVIGIPSTLRFGYILNACEQITAKDIAIKNALLRAFPNDKEKLSDALNEAGKTKFSSYNIEPVFHLFYPTIKFEVKAKNALVGVASEETDHFNKWRMVLLTLCASPDWSAI